MKTKVSIWDGNFIYVILSIIVGFLVGAILLVSAGIDPGLTYSTLFQGIFSRPKYIVYAFVYAAPYIMTGLSVAFSFKTGVFNIGAEGQFVVGSLAAVLVGIFGNFPPVIHPLICFVAAAAAGAAWGAVVGLMKIKRGINEVLSYIMFNWIAYYLSNYVVMHKGVKAQSIETTKNVKDSARTIIKGLIPVTGCTEVNAGFFIATICAILLWFVIKKTTFGYQLRAVGLSKTASEYGGISSSRIFMTSMAISGMLAGIGGAIQTLGMSGRIPQFSGQESFGFDGITVALIGGTDPIGCIFAGLFYGAMKYGGNKLTLVNAPKEIVNIIMGTIIFFIAISLLFKRIIKGVQQKKLDKAKELAEAKEA
ncbi:MAG: ABC transporter permease [Lachnospiraceae bacterium]|uniref:ABC transporter permease n=1 Tax=Candidatus Weimeria bifida TaxID=2599074 RepID=A0A6N7J215_9FIRM|nr:ABC transporter permease [Candidatus Weimeria bifida]RRF96785.1 MAG: ABC transporter permease [Lachnospiraceae bacterium]